jgi:hypothetical protein
MAASKPRAPRFPIQTTVHYRVSGEHDWHEGTSINISRTGVLFKAEDDLPPQTVLEMRIQFPAELTGDTPTNVVCWGPIIRRGWVEHPDSHPALAALIVRYRFTRD